MLGLKSRTPAEWVERVEANLPDVLIDHAHCERKAAGVAARLAETYSDHDELVREMREIVDEEMSHFEMVKQVLADRGIPFGKQSPSSYGARLKKLVRMSEPARAVDRLLIAGLIEARSCERFSLLKDRISDPALASFYADLFESEARHHGTYVRLAKLFAPPAEVEKRLHELSALEAEIIVAGDAFTRMHS